MAEHDAVTSGSPGPPSGGLPTSATALEDGLRRAARSGARDLEVDLAAVEALDARSLGVLLAAANTARARGGRLLAVGASPDVHRVLRALRLERHLEVRPR